MKNILTDVELDAIEARFCGRSGVQSIDAAALLDLLATARLAIVLEYDSDALWSALEDALKSLSDDERREFLANRFLIDSDGNPLSPEQRAKKLKS